MKIKMLPNWCKKLGVVLFISSFLIITTSVSVRESFCEGYNAGAGISASEIENIEPIFIEIWLGENAIHYFEVLLILGLLIYMLSKEKIEDDYINILRLQSYQLTSIFSLISTLILYAFLGDLKLGLDVFITLFLFIYLIVFALKKKIY